MLIGDQIRAKDNNFNLLRMLAATGVLVSHAWPITFGPGTPQPLSVSWGMPLGTVCVVLFFTISGFFITLSMERSSPMAFLRARALRLFPALLAVLLLTALVLGPLLSTASPTSYWAAVPSYLLRNLTLFFLQYPLPGVFETNPYGPAINGSLWTLNYEVLCYVGVFLMGISGVLARRPLDLVVLAVVIAGCLIAAFLPLPDRVAKLAFLAMPFALGALTCRLRHVLPLNPLIGLGLAVLTWLLRDTLLFTPLLVTSLSYGILWLGFAPAGKISLYNRLGDYSYGMYIYAFPVQQLVAASGITSVWLNIAIAVPVTLVLSVLSWKLVEEPALRLKRKRPTQGNMEKTA